MKRGMMLLRVVLFSLMVTGYFAEDIVPVRTGSGPTPRPGGNRRKDPTADLPNLSRDELLAILDLIEKSGDTPAPEARTVPPRYPTPTSKPLYPIIPTDQPNEPVAPQKPANGPVYPPTDAPFQRPIDPHFDNTPPNYPAPIAPPSPVTTPKPKRSFFDKIFRGFVKIVSPQTSGGTTTASPAALLNGFLSQLQGAQQSNTQKQNISPTASANILNNLLQRLQGQNSEGSQFVTNLVQTLQANNNNSPSASSDQSSTPARSGNSGQQLLLSLLKGVTQSGQQGQTGELSFAERLQREVFNTKDNVPVQPGQKSNTDLIFEGLRQVIQQTGRQ